jgi:hypothetical protein
MGVALLAAAARRSVAKEPALRAIWVVVEEEVSLAQMVLQMGALADRVVCLATFRDS